MSAHSDAAAQIAATKTALRREVRAKRRARGASATAALASAVADQINNCLDSLAPSPASLAAFCATPLEPPTERYLASARARGNRILLPVPEPGGRLSWVADTGVRDRHPQLQVPVPVGAKVPESEITTCAAIIAPAACVTRAGLRLGWGGGFYDRLFAALPDAVLRIALVHSDEIVDTLPHEPHDIPVNAIITPSGWFPAAGSISR